MDESMERHWRARGVIGGAIDSTRVEWGVLWLWGRMGWPDDPIQPCDDLEHAQRMLKSYGQDNVQLVQRTITVSSWEPPG